ncbi:hypothetical protein BRO17_07795 [Xanthomonas oryzae pv. oryzae]|nr:hypothetical protein BRO09_13185 [Xanthomonas oryzae pv. oryzae]RBB10776.1 hypothetical protein BRN92_05675 [Xanthomonas oryzae pv. oryzae]RBB19072.1 hypothetical protein BRN97_00955 [Xanthomonas oryzae pv. oryzae]RBB24265.1 hypothetical protein BRO13_02990 [Xanthomonas oryzae pv. oryzae]RBB87262.1 hypothetical protein BRN84_16080 [Xanthomonas oryzae pv. oryzae]
MDDATFDDRWKLLLRSGTQTPRDLYTVHLWGRGYWIWVIRLSQDRISVGATFDQRSPPPERRRHNPVILCRFSRDLLRISARWRARRLVLANRQAVCSPAGTLASSFDAAQRDV